MITMPEHVLATDAHGGWDGRSVDSNTGKEHDNKETGMDWAEHQRIVCEARKLLATKIETAPSTVRKAFEELKSAYEDGASRSEVRVSKGIHQPEDNPHIQLRVVTRFGKGEEAVRKFHLDVSAVDTPLKEEAFQWTGVRFSFKHNNNHFYWPLAASPIIKKRERRKSISDVDLQAHVILLAEIKAEEERVEAAKALDEKLKALMLKYGIAASNLSKLRRGSSVPGKDGAYQYGKDGSGLRFQRTDTRGYVDID